MLKRIVEMHNKFNQLNADVPFSKHEKEFRIICIMEEVMEYKDASTKEDELDALVDLVVFALGTAQRQGMIHIFQQAYDRVMDKNMEKEVGPKDERAMAFHLDLVKPEGWTAPDFSDLFNQAQKSLLKEIQDERT
tara:strand:+ start:95 stop:499 length:405 start_codon:yes stop_codon:yes gene_type:complete